jgi:hypothetical protein
MVFMAAAHFGFVSHKPIGHILGFFRVKKRMGIFLHARNKGHHCKEMAP